MKSCHGFRAFLSGFAARLFDALARAVVDLLIEGAELLFKGAAFASFNAKKREAEGGDSKRQQEFHD
jgi:hypothetical protein